MKVLVVLFALASLASTGPVKPARRYFHQEKNPDFKRYIYVENSKGSYELVDLRATEPNKITPRAALTDVTYYFYSLKNQASPYVITNNNVNALKSTYFDPSKFTMFIIHGWNNNRDSPVNQLIREAVFAANLDFNVFVVDWSGPANSLYLVALGAVNQIGGFVGDFINSIQDTYGLDGSSFFLVGHSLGAHVVGRAGATANKKVGNVIGLDPAGPLISLDHPEDRLDETDGVVVQVIHTNGYLLGMATAIGDIDHYPNGGMGQPGCGLDLTGTCAHGKAYRYFAEAISSGSVFRSFLCTNYDDYERGLCGSNAEAIMGELQSTAGSYGDYYLDTNADAPYAIS